jgi:hypothetical protein
MSYIDNILTQLIALDFDNDSNDAIYAAIAQAVGEVLDNFTTEFTNTQNVILNIINNQRYGKAGYYIAKALAFQDGDDLIPSAGTLDPTYAIIDVTKQIVKAAAFQSNSGQLSIKIAGQDPISGNLIQLTQQQISDFVAYFVNFQILGVPVSTICLPANIFSFSAICTFTGGYNLSNLQTNIASAMAAFQTSFNQGNFNGTLFTDGLSSFVKANVPGVVDFYVYNTQVDGASFAGSTVLTAGYFNYVSGITSNIAYNAQ